MAIKFITYSRRVSAPRELAEVMDCLVLRQENSRYRPRFGDTIINWGCSSVPPVLAGHNLRYLNHPDLVSGSVDKRNALRVMSAAGVAVVENTRDLEEARRWYDRGLVVIQRNQVSGMQGEGIVVCDPEIGPPPNDRGRLWTKYFNRKDEYRVHVCRGEAIDVQKKRLSTEVRDRLRTLERGTAAQRAEASNVYRVRSYPNGWVFCRQNIVCPGRVLQESIRAVSAFGLDFGAVDIGYKRSDSSTRVFEVNTAPGIEGSSIGIYAGALSLAVNRA